MSFEQLLGNGAAIAAVREELARLIARPAAAQRRLPAVLITGETGTGKGLVAHLVHQMGPRSSAAFVDVNCAAIPDTLLEAELFGFERGAFTDARQAKAGLLQVAHRGTIFLDEIGLMHDALQVKLLKALEDRAVRRLGSTRSEPADAWVLAATSEDLTAAIRARRFREDLYHRLAVVVVHLPPLRERGTDVLMLARHYLDKACTEYGLPVKALTPDGEAALMAYAWPGNVRELANLMERVALLSESDRVNAAALKLPRHQATPPPSAENVNVTEAIAQLERTRLEEALQAESWNVSRAAARLGLPRNTLRYRMERHGLVPGHDTPRRPRADSAATRSTPDAPPRAPERRASVQWQRSRVTMLQAQLAGAPSDAAMHERGRVLEEVAVKASAFGGRMIEVSADSVKVAFGLDVAEDAATHAAQTAFALQRATGASPRSTHPLRIAVHSEEMLVGRAGDRVELDADARRSAESTLEGLLAVSPLEDVVASSTTKPFLERRFEIEPIGATTPTTAWRVLRFAEAQQHSAPFVSRARELSLLDDLLAQVEAGQGQAVLVSGDPGIGKTRLLEEFRRRSGGRAIWWQGAAVSYGASLPLHPVIDLLRNALAVQPGDAIESIADRIERATRGNGAELQSSVPFLRALMSIEPLDPSIATLDPQLRRAGTFEAIGRFLHAASQAQPLILVLEDLHWMDSATAQFLSTMPQNLSAGRILLCVTHRTGHTLPFAAGTFATQVTLSRVSSVDGRAIGSSLVGGLPLSNALQQFVDSKADGNPFFIEEVVRSLRERGLIERRGDAIDLARPIGRLDVPDSVRDILIGRLGRLDAGARDLIRIAAVMGREFPRRVLEHVVGETQIDLDERLRALRTAELVYNARVWPETVYAFKHALTHEVAYEAQTPAERRAEHARIGQAVEQVYAERLSDYFGVLAHHFTQAEQWQKSLDYLLAAAQRAEEAFATREALALYDEALRSAARLSGGVGEPDVLIAIHKAKARLYAVTSEFVRSGEEGERMLPLARLIGNRTSEAEALVTIAWASTWARNLDAALRYAREALAVAEPAGALAVQGRAHFTYGFVRGVTGVLDESDAALQKARAISSAAGDAVHHSLTLSTAGLLRNWAGEFAEAVRLQDEGLALARERGLLVPLLFSCFFRGLTLTSKGDYDAAFAAFTEGLSVAERVGDEAIHHRLLNCLGWLYADLGDLDESEALNARSAEIGRRRSDPGTQPNAELNLADIYRARGDLLRAQDQYNGVFRYWKNPSASLWMRFRYSIRMFASMGELALTQGDLAMAKSHQAECLALATRTGAKKNLVKARRLAGQIAWAERDIDAAESHLRAARDLASTLGNPVQRWKSELMFGQFLREQRRDADALQSFQRAAATMERVREGLREPRLLEAFEKNEDVRKVHSLIARV